MMWVGEQVHLFVGDDGIHKPLHVHGGDQQDASLGQRPYPSDLFDWTFQPGLDLAQVVAHLEILPYLGVGRRY